MKDLKFRVKNEEHSKAIQERLFELGYLWGNGDKIVQLKDALYLFGYNSGHITCSDGEEIFKKHENKEVTLDDLYEMEKDVTVEINDEYRAVISKDEITVGCQTIPFKKVKEIYKAIKKLQND